MEKITLTKPELVLLLKKQLASIEDLCSIFDLGKEYISQDIAVKLRVIMHNTNTSKSLLTHLKLNHLKFYSGCVKKIKGNLIKSHLSLLVLRHEQNKDWSYAANLDKQELRQISFESWWNSEIIITDIREKNFTRSWAIKTLANKDGGAHVDEKFDDDYYSLSRLDASGWVINDNEEKKTYLNPIPASIRQMAFEVLETFRNIDIYQESKLYYKEVAK